MNNQKKWDLRFLELAKHISTWSKDPSTQVGAIIVDKDKRIISTGYNGFPQGISDDNTLNNRDIKYLKILHGEINCLLFSKSEVKNCIIYTYPFMPCCQCMAAIIQSGIKRIVSIKETKEQKKRWGLSIDTGLDMAKQANIEIEFYNHIDI